MSFLPIGFFCIPHTCAACPAVRWPTALFALQQACSHFGHSAAPNGSLPGNWDMKVSHSHASPNSRLKQPFTIIQHMHLFLLDSCTSFSTLMLKEPLQAGCEPFLWHILVFKGMILACAGTALYPTQEGCMEGLHQTLHGARAHLHSCPKVSTSLIRT